MQIFVQLMDIINSLVTISNSKADFKKWEEENKDRNSQRQILSALYPLEGKDLENAKKNGKTLIDVVDIMDRHSEDVAQDTESAVTLMRAVATFGSLLALIPASIKFLILPNGKKVMNIYESEHALHEAEYNNISVKIAENIKKTGVFPDENSAKKLADLRVRYAALPYIGRFFKGNLLKNVDEADKKNVEEQISKLSKNMKQAIRKPLSKTALGVALPPLAGLAGFVTSIIIGTKLQIEASRVARWQSRNDLENEKYFVNYTDEQIQNAKNRLEKNQPKKTKSQKNKNSIFNVLKDNSAYNEWKKTDRDNSALIDRELTDSELEKAERDKDYIQRITSEINNRAEEYSENMGVLSNVLFATTPVLSVLLAQPLAFGIEKSGLGKFLGNTINNKYIKSYEPSRQADAKAVFENLRAADAEKSGFLEKLNKNIDAFKSLENLKNTSNLPLSEKITEIAKRVLNLAGSSEFARNKIIVGLAALPAALAGIFLTLNLQKASSRVGRFSAKRELEKNPENFAGYTPDEYGRIEFVKNKKESFGEKFLKYPAFAPKIFMEYADYKKYIKTEGRKNRVLLRELVKNEDVSEEQLKDARNLQRKIFNTFEKIDDNSQIYSESLEGAVAIAQPAVRYAGIATAFLVPLALFLSKHGKFSPDKIVSNIIKFVEEHPKILENKTVSKYFAHVRQNSELLLKSQESDINTLKANELLKEKIASHTDYHEVLKAISDMSEDEINTVLKALKIDNLDKNAIFKTLNNIDNITRNIESDELNKVINIVLKKLEENPIGFLKIASDPDSLRKLFMTTDLGRLAVTAGAGWFAINFAVTFIIESYLAELQKKAGRLGTMKALEGLQNPKYYADKE